MYPHLVHLLLLCSSALPPVLRVCVCAFCSRWLEALDEGARLSAFGAKMANHQTLKAWNQWTGQALEWRRLKTFGSRMMQVGMVKCLNTWCEWIEERQRLTEGGASCVIAGCASRDRTGDLARTAPILAC